VLPCRRCLPVFTPLVGIIFDSLFFILLRKILGDGLISFVQTLAGIPIHLLLLCSFCPFFDCWAPRP